MDGLIFDDGDSELKTIPVRFRGRDYVLREATAEAAARYRNAFFQCGKMVDGKVVGMEGMADLEHLLVSLCLLETADGQTVPKEEVATWPSRIVKKLFNAAKRMSDLDEEEDTVESIDARIKDLSDRRDKMIAGSTAAKNGPSAATATSA